MPRDMDQRIESSRSKVHAADLIARRASPTFKSAADWARRIMSWCLFQPFSFVSTHPFAFPCVPMHATDFLCFICTPLCNPRHLHLFGFLRMPRYSYVKRLLPLYFHVTLWILICFLAFQRCMPGYSFAFLHMFPVKAPAFLYAFLHVSIWLSLRAHMLPCRTFLDATLRPYVLIANVLHS